MNNKGTYTITFGDQAENHAGMEKIGEASNIGFTLDDMNSANQKFNEKGYKTELIDLSQYHELKNNDTKAYLLVIRNGINALGNLEELYKETCNQNVDKKVWMRGKVKNKQARWNICYGNINQEPNYEEKKGRIVAFKDVQYINEIKQNLPLFFGDKSNNLVAELNYYYDITKCGIGYHGDSERKIVIAFRLGESIPLHYNWYLNAQPIGKNFHIILNHGDVYMMSEKAVGQDWKKQRIPTLRHAAGCNKYTTIKIKPKKLPKKKIMDENDSNNNNNIGSTKNNQSIKKSKKRKVMDSEFEVQGPDHKAQKLNNEQKRKTK